MDKTERVVTHSARETQDFFQKLARRLKPGHIVGFVGELGAGKTTAIQAILSEFGILGGESPTFVMVRPYQPAKPKRDIKSIVHIDAYRLESMKDAETTGLNDFLHDPRAVVLVEWADQIRRLLPPSTLWITMHHAGEDKREIEVTWP